MCRILRAVVFLWNSSSLLLVVFPFVLWTTSVTLHSCQQIIPEKIVSSFKNIVSIDRKKGTILFLTFFFLIVVKVT